MIGVITFKIKTTGKYTKNDKEEITYSLDMSAPIHAINTKDSNNKSIFITPSVKLEKKLSYDNDDYKNVFTSYGKFKQLVKESIEKNGETKIDEKETILSNLNFNINFIKNIFFPQKSKLKIKGDRYSVNSSGYIDGQYEINDIKMVVNDGADKTSINKSYTVHIELNLTPIPVISGLQFRIKTTKFKDVEKNEKYDSMPDPDFMFITPSVKLTMNDLHYSYINGDYKKLFTSFQDFSALVDYIANKEEVLDKRDPDYENKKKALLNNNIKLIKSIFFPNKSKYSYRKQKFVIGKSNYIDNDYDTNPSDVYKKTDNYKALSNSCKSVSTNATRDFFTDCSIDVKEIYIANLELTFLDIPLGSEEPSKADFTRLSCSEKAKELENQMRHYFDVDVNLFEKPKQIIVKKSQYEIAMENENKRRKEEQQKKDEDIIRKKLEEKERFLILTKRDDERKKKEADELKKKEILDLIKQGGKYSKKIGLYKKYKKNRSRKNK